MKNIMEDIYQEIARAQKTASLHWFHWLVVGLSLVITFVAWYVSQHEVNEKAATRFENQSNQVIAMISERMQKYEDALHGGVAAINALPHGMDYAKWKRFAESLHINTKYPGINGIGVIYYVPPEKLNDYLAQERKLRPDYHIHPAHSNNEYWPITYVEPAAINAQAIGLDMAHEEHRFTAAKRARDTGVAQITAPIVLVQDSQKTPGFLFYVPFYKGADVPATLEERQQQFIGMVYAPFITRKLVDGTLKKDNRLVNIRLRDGQEVIYDEFTDGAEDLYPNPLYTKTIELEMYGRPWQVDIRSALSFRTLAHNNQPMIVLIGGLLVDAMLFWVFMLLARSNKRAVDLAKGMTRDLRDLKNAMENAVEGAAKLDVSGRYVYVNEAYAAMADYEPEELMGKEWPLTVHPDDRSLMLEEYQRMLSEGKVITEARGLKKDDTVFHKQLTMIADYDEGGAFLGHYCFMKDISYRKTVEAGQQMLMEQLTKSNTELERFAYIASHDMQEPLRMVTNFSSIVLKDYSHCLDDEGREYLRMVSDAGLRMRDLVNDLLEYSRIGNEVTRNTDCNLRRLLDYAIENLHQLIEETGARVRCDDALPQICVNSVQIIRLLQNLIANGIKYQPEGNTPEIYLSAVEEEDCFRVCIKDNGLGVAPAYHEQIFQPFRRLQHHSTIKGTGLGLSVCRKIVETHGGTIHVLSEQGKGSCFEFTLAKRQQQQEAA